MPRSWTLLAFALLSASSCAQHVVPPAPVRLTQCTRGPLRNDTLRTLDVRAATLSISLTTAGTAIDAAQLDGSRLVFRAVDRRSEATIHLGADAASGFSAMLATGTYDVFFAKGPKLVECRTAAGAALPCLGGAVARRVEVREGTQSLALDLAPQTYRVRIIPDALRAREDRTYSLRCEEQWLESAPVTGPAELEFSALPTRCSLYSNATGGIGRDELEQEITLEPQQRALVATLRAAEVRVTMQTNFGDYASVFYEHSQLEVRPVDRPNDVYYASFAPNSASDTLTITLAHGTYDIDWVMDNRFARTDAITVRVPVARGAHVTDTTTFRRALDTVRIDADVQFESAATAQQEDSAGSVTFSLPDQTSITANAGCGVPNVANRFRTWAPRGATQALVSATLRDSHGEQRTYGTFTLDASATQRDGVVVVRAPVVQVTPRLMIDGRVQQSFPAHTFASRLNNEQLLDETVWLNAPARAFAGTLDVVFGAVEGAAIDPMFPIPETVGVVRGGLRITGSSSPTVELKTVPITGIIRLNGQSFVAVAGREATVRVERVRFSGVGSANPDPATPAAITASNDVFSSLLFADDYTARIDQGSCTSAEAATRLCGSVLVHGCE